MFLIPGPSVYGEVEGDSVMMMYSKASWDTF